MPYWRAACNTLCKGLLVLSLPLILLFYTFGSIDNRGWDVRPNYNTTRFSHPPKVSEIVQTPSRNLTSFRTTNAEHNNISTLTVIDLNSTYSTESHYSLTSNKFNATTVLPLCPEDPPNLQGKVPVIKHSVPKIYDLERRFSWLKPGGHWSPENCRVEKKVAIIIPFRCRGKHLLIFLQHMHPFLKKQQLDYTIFIIEQDGNGAFNRAMLMNVGFKEALKIRDFDCFIFHDVDLLPEDDRNLYNCPVQPRHMSVAIDVFRYKLPYRTIFGGVSAISKDHFQLLNGFSNSFWGWGGEDDDMSNRINYHNLHISRYPLTIAKYTMLTHKKDTPSPTRYDTLKAGQKKYDTDGLNSLKYTVQKRKENLLYTWILVSIERPS